MREIEKLLKKHKKEIKDLQKKCKHENISDWIRITGLYCHLIGTYIKKCFDCGKIIDKIPNKRIIEED